MQFYEDYINVINYYSAQNPVGCELYQKQLEYLKYLQNKEDKKNRPKDSNPKPTETKPRPTVKEEEKVFVRSTTDPEISLQKLMAADWDPSKYISTSVLAKENANIVFIGHVDSGKSTLTGNIIKELKEVDEQELARNKLEAKQNKMEAW